MASVTRSLTQKLKLKVKEAKSAVAQPEERKFLGFTITNDGAERRIAPKALGKFKMKIGMSSHPAVQKALRNHAFDDLGLPRLYVALPRCM
jgi:hypothetical protein